MKNGKQNASIHYVQPVIFYTFLYVLIFHLFSNISKTVLESSHIWFCREFHGASFGKTVSSKDQKGKKL
jgi:hypothetical protein